MSFSAKISQNKHIHRLHLNNFSNDLNKRANQKIVGQCIVEKQLDYKCVCVTANIVMYYLLF